MAAPENSTMKISMLSGRGPLKNIVVGFTTVAAGAGIVTTASMMADGKTPLDGVLAILLGGISTVVAGYGFLYDATDKYDNHYFLPKFLGGVLTTALFFLGAEGYKQMQADQQYSAPKPVVVRHDGMPEHQP